MGFCSCTFKFVLFVFNLVGALLGIAVLGVAIYAQVNNHTVNGHVGAGPIVIIVLASAVTLTAFFGCWGAIQENRCFLNTYAVILSCLLIGMVAIGIVVLVGKTDAEKETRKWIQQIFDQAYNGDSAAQSEVDDIQSSMYCCGVDGPGDWAHRGKQIPISCCKNENNGQFCSSVSNAYKKGCEQAVSEVIKAVLQGTGVFTIVVGGVLFSAVFMSIFLAHSIKRQELRSYS